MKTLIFTIAASVLLSTPAFAAFLCDELWGERNAVYAEAGYCFKTAKAIAAFGNAGCRFDRLEDVPLSDRDRAKVREIEREERRNGCRS
ncbi:YARHG domain-containing protein [Methylopila sp. 73B]|uniref:YARHG domain-containing protein n=1 Tax=Methylopila sp. 73B TaxID=1120792 RepID=UPI00036FF8A2|nr:YARHG domain-containing protein [Methylopila sp. 73B]